MNPKNRKYQMNHLSQKSLNYLKSLSYLRYRLNLNYRLSLLFLKILMIHLNLKNQRSRSFQMYLMNH